MASHLQAFRGVEQRGQQQVSKYIMQVRRVKMRGDENRDGGVIGHETYPILPVIPVAAPDLGGEYPAFAPEQDKDPEEDDQVGEAEEALPGQVPPELEGGARSEAREAALAPELGGQVGPEVVKEVPGTAEDVIAYGLEVGLVPVVVG